MDKSLDLEDDEGGRRMVSSYHACKEVPIELLDAGVVQRLVRVRKAFNAGEMSEEELTGVMKTMGIAEKAEGATGG